MKPLEPTLEVLAMGKINFSGNIIPERWFQFIRSGGKVNLAAVMILSEIVWWYRPMEIRDEASGMVIELCRKFRGETLQRSHQSFAHKFGITKKQSYDACKLLEKLNLIELILEKSVTLPSGDRLGNVLYIRVLPENIMKITHPLSLGGDRVQPPSDRVQPPSDRVQPPSDRVQPPSDRVQPPSDRVQPPSDRVQPPSDRVQPPSDRVQPPSDRVQPPSDRVQPPGKTLSPASGTYTEITTETTSEISTKRSLSLQERERENLLTQNSEPDFTATEPDSALQPIALTNRPIQKTNGSAAPPEFDFKAWADSRNLEDDERPRFWGWLIAQTKKLPTEPANPSAVARGFIQADGDELLQQFRQESSTAIAPNRSRTLTFTHPSNLKPPPDLGDSIAAIQAILKLWNWAWDNPQIQLWVAVANETAIRHEWGPINYSIKHGCSNWPDWAIAALAKDLKGE